MAPSYGPCITGQSDELSVCWNNLIRRIFNMHKWESVKLIRYYCGRLDFTRLCDLCRLRFLHKMSSCQNIALKECFPHVSSASKSFEQLRNAYNVNFSLSLHAVDSAVCSKFVGMCGMWWVLFGCLSLLCAQSTCWHVWCRICFYLVLFCLSPSSSYLIYFVCLSDE